VKRIRRTIPAQFGSLFDNVFKNFLQEGERTKVKKSDGAKNLGADGGRSTSSISKRNV